MHYPDTTNWLIFILKLYFFLCLFFFPSFGSVVVCVRAAPPSTSISPVAITTQFSQHVIQVVHLPVRHSDLHSMTSPKRFKNLWFLTKYTLHIPKSHGLVFPVCPPKPRWEAVSTSMTGPILLDFLASCYMTFTKRHLQSNHLAPSMARVSCLVSSLPQCNTKKKKRNNSCISIEKDNLQLYSTPYMAQKCTCKIAVMSHLDIIISSLRRTISYHCFFPKTRSGTNQ